MIATVIVLASVALAAAFSAAWWVRPGLRSQIEAPSQRFAAQARRYDQACHDRRHEEGESKHGHN